VYLVLICVFSINIGFVGLKYEKFSEPENFYL